MGDDFFVQYDSEQEMWFACNGMSGNDYACNDMIEAVNVVKIMRICWSFRGYPVSWN